MGAVSLLCCHLKPIQYSQRILLETWSTPLNFLTVLHKIEAAAVSQQQQKQQQQQLLYSLATKVQWVSSGVAGGSGFLLCTDLEFLLLYYKSGLICLLAGSLTCPAAACSTALQCPAILAVAVAAF